MLNENKQLNKPENIKDNSLSFSPSGLSIFKDNSNLTFVFKKTEKIISAIYLLSNFISDKEPLKWQLRETSLCLLSACLTRPLNQVDFVSQMCRLISLLEISFSVGFISEMNHQILKYELESLLKMVDTEKWSGEVKSMILPEHFFAVNDEANDQQMIPEANKKSFISEAFISHKGHNTMSDRLSFKKEIQSVKTGEIKQKDKSNRQDTIMSLLKNGTELSIKDFTSAITGCSEKTIQRELISLVSKGQIVKKGEKRWSKYSLK